MPDSCALRAMKLIRDWFAADAGIVTCSLDLRSYDEDVKADEKPALFIVRGTPRTALARETSRGTVEPLALDLVGYTESPSGSAEGVTEVREAFLQVVYSRLYQAFSGDSLLKQLQIDYAAHGNGLVSLEHVAPPTTDQGYVPPHGIFELPCEGRLHYRDHQF